jgi:nitrate reductase gamma subunit
MTTLFYLAAYAAILGFIFFAVTKVRGYLAASPLHVRWELYPVPHEGKKAAYGGSCMDEKEWWTKPRHIDHMGDLIALLKEVLFLEATFTHNRPLWFRTYPFHFGLYMMMGGMFVVLFAVILKMFGVADDNGFVIFIGNVINAISMLGLLGIVGGGIGLIYRRLDDKGLRRYSTPEHFFNLGAFVVYALFGLAAWATQPSFFALSRDFMYNLFTFNFVAQVSSPFAIHMFIGFIMMVWIPMTNMSHLIYKYFNYHDIRWGDTPTNDSVANQKKIGEMLGYKPTWSAEHIAGDGNKTWVDVAVTNPTAPKQD